VNEWDGDAYDAHLDNYGDPDMEPEPCDHPPDQISYHGMYRAECQQCGEPVVTPDPDELWEDSERFLALDSALRTGAFLPRIGLVHGE
jgi:hypothetical protein